MDGVFSTGRATVREDNLSKQEMRHKARKLWLGRCLLQLQRMGSSGLLHSPIQSRRDCMIGSVPPLFCVVLLSRQVWCSRLLPLNLFSLVTSHPYFYIISYTPHTFFPPRIRRRQFFVVFWASVHPRRNVRGCPPILCRKRSSVYLADTFTIRVYECWCTSIEQ